jgi:hypothetical protein
MYHITWGIKTNSQFMLDLCPRARPVGVGALPARLMFRGGYANAEYDPSSIMQVAIWAVTGECEETLDRHSVAIGHEKRYLKIKIDGQVRWGFAYMTNAPQRRPNDLYVERLYEGYEQWGFDRSVIDEALKVAILA